jgi:hypothetical protein
MRCLFCKKDSSQSRSVEHILPQSLGNLSQTLPRGVVCDSCNNYFAAKVEKPFLELKAIELLRFHQAVPSKKGVVPSASGVLVPEHPVVARRHLKGPFVGSVDVPPQAFAQILREKRGIILFPSDDALPKGPIVSRFLAKVALEAMAQRLVKMPEGLEYLVGEEQLDPVRNHARRGEQIVWPFHVRRIYDERTKWMDEAGEVVQLVHENDILVTDEGEWYFILAVFGIEFSINYGGPEIDGYELWLKQHNYVSPLYWGKNLRTLSLRRLD